MATTETAPEVAPDIRRLEITNPQIFYTGENLPGLMEQIKAAYARLTGYGLTEKQADSLTFMLRRAVDMIWSRAKRATFFKSIILSDICPGLVAVHIDFGSASDRDCRNWSLLNYRQSLNIGKNGGYSTHAWNKKQKKSVLKTGNDLLLDYDFWGKA